MSLPPTISRTPAPPARFFMLVAVGGGAGSLARHGALSAGVLQPAVTVLLINVTGSALLGALLAWLRSAADTPQGRRPTPAELVALLGTGFCGGLTTFSTHMVDVANRIGSSPTQALASLLATALLAVGAAATGYAIADRRAGVSQAGSTP